MNQQELFNAFMAYEQVIQIGDNLTDDQVMEINILLNNPEAKLVNSSMKDHWIGLNWFEDQEPDPFYQVAFGVYAFRRTGFVHESISG